MTSADLPQADADRPGVAGSVSPESPSGQQAFASGVELPETATSRAIDRVLTVVGRVASWLWVVLLGVIIVNVTLRYLFREGRIELEELQWHLNAVAFLLAIAYAYRVDAHIRIDLVSNRLRPRLQVLDRALRYVAAALALHRRGACLQLAVRRTQLAGFGNLLVARRAAVSMVSQGLAAGGVSAVAGRGGVAIEPFVGLLGGTDRGAGRRI